MSVAIEMCRLCKSVEDERVIQSSVFIHLCRMHATTTTSIGQIYQAQIYRLLFLHSQIAKWISIRRVVPCTNTNMLGGHERREL